MKAEILQILEMQSEDPEFRLVIVGDGPARDRLQAFADDLRVSSRIQFTGPVSDAVLHRWLRTARVVVSLPGERSSGMAVTEACTAGVSVVASISPSSGRPPSGWAVPSSSSRREAHRWTWPMRSRRPLSSRSSPIRTW